MVLNMLRDFVSFFINDINSISGFSLLKSIYYVDILLLFEAFGFVFFIGSLWQEIDASDDKTDRDISTSLKVMTRRGNLSDMGYFFVFISYLLRSVMSHFSCSLK